MSQFPDPSSLAAAIEKAATALARAEGLRAALESRAGQLEREVGHAKGRLAVKSEVEKFLEELQTDASRRNMETFEALLTALVGEVLPGEKPVKLDLSTERGMPALDISVAGPDGVREDVFSDQGGAMTNVIGMGLRLISVVKSRSSRFLLLDEADCWIEPDRVPSFYRVLQDGAARLGVQCLAISHHDISKFSTGMRISRLEGHPKTGVSFTSGDMLPEWPDDAAGFRTIRLINVQGYPDSTLVLSPGVNALTGRNNHGKSTMMRALRAVFYGEATDALVRRGEKFAAVEIGLAQGRILRFSRQPRRNPVNMWSLHETDGSLVEENGAKLETGGKVPPEWLDRLFGITKIEGLDVHIAHQKVPVFLLQEPASKRASVLSIGQEAGYAREMLAIHKERCNRDAQTVREGEREYGRLKERLSALGGLAGIAERLAEARAMLADLVERTASAAKAEAAAVRLTATAAALRGLAARATALAALPDEATHHETLDRLRSSHEQTSAGERLLSMSEAIAKARRRASVLAELPDAMPEIMESAETIRLGKAVKESRLALGTARSRSALLGELPEWPELAEGDPADRLVEAISASARSAEEKRTAAATVEDRIAAAREEMARLVEETGGVCPACGQAVSDPELLLSGHAH